MAVAVAAAAVRLADDACASITLAVPFLGLPFGDRIARQGVVWL